MGNGISSNEAWYTMIIGGIFCREDYVRFYNVNFVDMPILVSIIMIAIVTAIVIVTAISLLWLWCV